MKKRSQTSNPILTNILTITSKYQSRSTHKPKKISSNLIKNNSNDKQDKIKIQKNSIKKNNKKNRISEQHSIQKNIQEYIIIDDTVYKANTNTQRKQMNIYVNRCKKQANFYQKNNKMSTIPKRTNKYNFNNHYKQKQETIQQQSQQRICYNLRKNNKQQQRLYRNVKVEEIVKNLPIQQKLALMKQLQKQLNYNQQLLQTKPSVSQQPQPHPQSHHQSHQQSHFHINLPSQSQKIQQKLTLPIQQINPQQKYNILNIKLNILQKQLSQKRQTQIQKINKMFYQGQLTASQRKNKIIDINKVKQRKIKIIKCTRNLFYTLLYNKFQNEYFKNGKKSQNQIDDVIKQLDSFSEFDGQPENSISQKNIANDSAKQENQSSIQSQFQLDKNGSKYQCYQQKAQLNSDKKSIQEQSLLISPDKSAQKIQKQRQRQKEAQSPINFQCSQQNVSISRRLQIPLLLTKQKLEQMQWQKKAKALTKMKTQIQKKTSFQMSQLQLQQVQNHFTTLADINGFIVAFYEYIIKKDLEHVVERLNMPYGKATRDKLFLLQQNGQVDDMQYYSILDQSHLNGFNMQIALSVRRVSDHEKIHNKAVFDSFNSHLNAYRPYYDLEGDVYPWLVSEKGLTFYQINQENIQQVFQKTKIKVLQQSSILCGIIPFGIDASEAPQPIKQKNNENFAKQQKLSLIQNFQKWNIKIMDYDTMVRLLIAQQIYQKQLMDFTKYLHNIQKN